MINIYEVNETNKMIQNDNLDVRTITMGINLLDEIAGNAKDTTDRICNKIRRLAGNLVDVGEQISKELGVPIVNKRISLTPLSLVSSGFNCEEDFVYLAKNIDDVAVELGVNFIGGFSAIVDRAMTKSDLMLINSIPRVLSETKHLCSSVNIGSTKYGINMEAVAKMGEIISKTAWLTKDEDSIGCAKLVVFCNAPDDNPFMAGAFHGITQGDATINVGVSGPGVVKKVLESADGMDLEEVCELIKKTAFKITRVGQLVASMAAKRLNIPFGIIDLSLAPTPAVGDSVADILKLIGVDEVGTHGTTLALAMLNDCVKKGGIMASSNVGGLSGAFIPVSEDKGMIDAVLNSSLSIDKLEAMTCVCSVGLDMIAIPGDTKSTTISGIIGDEAAIGMINQKTTAVRVIPVVGKNVGDMVEFGGLLGFAPVQAVNKFGCDRLINRGGRVPAPIHSFKN